jgi:peptidoglycan hydrolase CwlO-like protein
MKKIALLLCAAFMMSAAMPVYAAETSAKDECLLASKNCASEVDSIQKKIKKLQAEIKKGKKVYSAEELKKLQAKLDEADKMLDGLLNTP